MFAEVYILFHFNIILNTTGGPLLKLKKYINECVGVESVGEFYGAGVV